METNSKAIRDTDKGDKQGTNWETHGYTSSEGNSSTSLGTGRQTLRQ